MGRAVYTVVGVPGLSERLRRAFYRADGPWKRCVVFERFGSQRYSRPALHGIDGKLEELLPQTGGVFIEAGAHDGYTQSNTYFLERHRGWSGLLVEAIPELNAKASKRRSARVVQAALVGPDHGSPTAEISFGDLMSKIDDDGSHTKGGLDNAGRSGYVIEVPARTLSSLLDDAEIQHVDLLSLDVEGFELEVLRGIDFDRHVIDTLVVEMLDMGTQRPAFDALLGDRYEFTGTLSVDDAVYRRKL